MINEFKQIGLASLLLLLLSVGQLCFGQPGNEKEVVGERSADTEPAKPELRIWKDNSGKFELLARFVEKDGATIVLERENGKRIRVPLDRLSQPDQDHIRDLPSDNPFEVVEEAALPRSAASLVMVAIDHDGQEEFRQGYVFRKSDELAYVAVPTQAHDDGVKDVFTSNFTILIDTPERRSVKAKPVAEFLKTRTLVLTAAAAEMPDPVEFNLKTKIKNGDVISLIGYEYVPSAERLAPRIAETGRLKKFTWDAQGVINKLQIEAEDSKVAKGGFAIDVDGNVLGVIDEKIKRGEKIEIEIAPYDLLSKLDGPELNAIQFAAKSGDRQKINYQIVVEIADPFKKIKNASLLVKPLLSRQEPGPLDDAEKRELTPRAPDKNVRQQIELLGGRNLSGNTFVADFTTDNPGAANFYRLQVQLSYTTQAGELIDAEPVTIIYSPQDIENKGGRLASALELKSVVPDVPGFDGLPFDLPRVEKVAEGGWKLTSAKTAVTEKIEHKPKTFPAAVETNVTAVVRINRLDGVDALQLNINPKVDKTLMTFSGNGDLFYLVDAKNVLRKIRTADLVEEAKLEIGAECNNLACSKAGIVLLLKEKDVLWVLDEQDLHFKFEIPVPGVKLVVANPTTAIGIASGGPPPDFGKVIPPWTALFMLDLAEGQVIHEIRSKYGEEVEVRLTASKEALLGEINYSLHMSNDGKLFYTDGGGNIRRFRVDGRDLIFEELSKPLNSPSILAMSADGKWVYCNSGGFGDVFDARNLKEPKFKLKGGSSSACEFDPATGAIYAHDSLELRIMDSKGEVKSSIRWHQLAPRKMIVHPQGERFLIMGAKEVFYFDLNQKRTFSQVKGD